MMKDFIKKYKNEIIFALFVSIVFIGVLHHESFRDEAQSWLLAKNCSFKELIAMMKYEGHFLPWYLIIMPFAKLGFPYITQNIISLIIVSVSGWLILYKSPFKLITKVLILFTAPMIYIYSVIARCYALIPLVISLLCIFYKDRKEKPLRYIITCIFLANTHIIMLGMVGIIILNYIIELVQDYKKISYKDKKKRVGALIFGLLLLILSGIPLLGSLSINDDVFINKLSVLNSDSIIKMLFINPFMIIFLIYSSLDISYLNFCLFIIPLLIIIIFTFKNNKINYLEILMIIWWQSFISVFIYPPSINGASSLIFVVLYFAWISKYKKNNTNKIAYISIIFLLCLNIFIGLSSVYKEYNYDYSSAKKISTYINNNLEDNSVILCGARSEMASSLIPYLRDDIKVFQVGRDNFVSYTITDKYNSIELNEDSLNSIKDKFKNNIYLLSYFDGESNEISFITFNSDIKVEESTIKDMIDKNILIEVYNSKDHMSNNKGIISLVNENYILFKVDLNNIKTD